MFKLFVCLVLCCGLAVEAKNWALLTAGSNTWDNYRHQADVCHAYQIVHKNGIPDEQVVVMMYDDLANDDENPTKGKIINKPNGPDVYHGVPKDYTQDNVTPQMFLNVLQGKKVTVGSKKVIQSGPEDNVFVYFADHGAPGLVAFPNGDVLHASDLVTAIKNMHKNKKFKNLVIYVEACESGSMFDKLLPNNINVFATTASTPDESSYACYYDDSRETYLGDLYSVDWMEDSDKGLINKETLFKQFQIVKTKTDQSTVCEYGNVTLGKTMFVADFQAEKGAIFRPKTSLVVRRPTKITDSIKSEDVRMSILTKKLAKETDPSKREQILAKIESASNMKKLASETIQKIAKHAVQSKNLDVKHIIESKSTLNNHECYKPSVNHVLTHCFNAKNEYVLRNLYVLVNLCENGVEAEQIMRSIEHICAPQQ